MFPPRNVCSIVAHCRKYGIYSAISAILVQYAQIAITLTVELRLERILAFWKAQSTWTTKISNSDWKSYHILRSHGFTIGARAVRVHVLGCVLQPRKQACRVAKDRLRRVLNPFLLRGDTLMHRTILVSTEKRMLDRCALPEIWHL